MSAICIVNLKEHNLNFDELNALAKKIVKYCLDHELGAAFNAFDYGENLIEEENMRNFFLLSDSFLYKNCDILNDIPFVDSYNVSDSEKVFTEKYSFFNDILKIIFSFNVYEVTVLIDTWETESVADFNRFSATPDNFTHLLFESVKNYTEQYHQYIIPALKVTVKAKT